MLPLHYAGIVDKNPKKKGSEMVKFLLHLSSMYEEKHAMEDIYFMSA